MMGRRARRAARAEVVVLKRGRRDEPSGGAPPTAPAPVHAPAPCTRAEVVNVFREAARGYALAEPVQLSERKDRDHGMRRIVVVGAGT